MTGRRAARARRCHGLDVHVPAGLRLLQPGLRERDRVRAVHGDRRAGDPPVPVPAGADVMSAARDTPARVRRRREARATRRGRRELAGRAPWWLYVLLALGLRADGRAVPVDAARPFKPQAELRTSPPTLLPQDPTLDELLATSSPSSTSRRYFFNSALIAVTVTVGQPAVLLDARLRAGEAAFARPARSLRRSCWRR